MTYAGRDGEDIVREMALLAGQLLIFASAARVGDRGVRGKLDVYRSEFGAP